MMSLANRCLNIEEVTLHETEQKQTPNWQKAVNLLTSSVQQGIILGLEH